MVPCSQTVAIIKSGSWYWLDVPDTVGPTWYSQKKRVKFVPLAVGNHTFQAQKWTLRNISVPLMVR